MATITAPPSRFDWLTIGGLLRATRTAAGVYLLGLTTLREVTTFAGPWARGVQFLAAEEGRAKTEEDVKVLSDRLHRDSFWQVAKGDEFIVARVLAGETQLFEILMRRYNQRVYRAVRALLKTDSEIEEVMQQTYVDAFAHLHQLSESARLPHWLVRIAVNECLTRLRHRTHFVPSGLGSERVDSVQRCSPDDPEEAASRRERARLLEAALDHLPARYRVVFVLREIEGLSTQDTALALGVTPAVVKTRLRRSKLSIRRQLGSKAHVGRDTLSFGGSRCDRVVSAVLRRILPLSIERHAGA